MKKIVFFIIAIIFFALLFLLFMRMFSCQRLTCMSVNNLNNFKMKTIYKESDDSFRALYTNGDKLLRVEVMSQMNQFTAGQYINADIAQIKGLFTDALAPYPGVASNTITCGIKYQPYFGQITTVNKLNVSYYIAYLNSNLTYGSCNDAQIIYKGISAYFYCPKNKQAFHLEIIAPRKEFESAPKDYLKRIESVKCK